MLVLLSPAKKLLERFKPYTDCTSQPQFLDKTNELALLMKKKSVADIAALMDLSQNLAELNYNRYRAFCLNDNKVAQSYPALFLFQGDVYQGLQAGCWNQRTLKYAQQHLRILSGLYGLLSPLDRIQCYRLEMGIALENPLGKNLYDFWQATLTQELNVQLAAQDTPVLINLASQEYFKVIQTKKINYPIMTINFYEQKNNALKMIGIHAKKARGLMAKFIMENQIDNLETLKEFKVANYLFHEATSKDNHLDFVRTSS